MDGTQLAVALLGSGGAGAVLVALVNGLWKWLNGSYGRQRSRNADLVKQRNDAYERARLADERADAAEARFDLDLDKARRELETESRYRRRLAEYASDLRRLAIEGGTEPSALPPFPSRDVD